MAIEVVLVIHSCEKLMDYIFVMLFRYTELYNKRKKIK